MKPLGHRGKHYWKLQQMLRVTGSDAVSAFEDGALSSDEWAGMVETCRACRWADGCAKYQKRTRLAGTQGAAPEQCLNRARLRKLRQHSLENT